MGGRGGRGGVRDVVPVTRYVPEAAEPFAAAFRELLSGATAAEREAGLSANFIDEQTADMLIEARIEGNPLRAGAGDRPPARREHEGVLGAPPGGASGCA
jgi:hypothetical protein